ncbi:Phosphoglucomutase-1 [Coccomyxa viridis]|uniref:phosphoglycerate mutase (2,3-diphosphoglycerate-independent) n=1 Tax=Coccomyxa viridis TaxID=1274662 RepID=A0AAV1I7H5_9CHLO|nr:Phosphoglucomutase-1 [Coccomyxa viridis]
MATDKALKPHDKISRNKEPVLVCILDGWGENIAKDKFNAIHSAETPVTDALKENKKRWRTVRAHGTAVGLPSDADMGNSEVGHNALGSGQVIDQGARLVDIALDDGSAFKLDGWKYISEAFSHNTLHFIGLLSDGGVHSRYDQLVGFVKGAARDGAKRIRVHILTDGRDVPDGTSVKFVEQLEKDLEALEGCDARIASGGGRMYVTMDRYEADWKIVERGWHAHVLGEAEHKFPSALEAIKKLRAGDGKKPVTDQWLPPFVVVGEDGKPVGTIEDGDAVALFNFRSDRMVQISKAFEYEDFNAFDRKRFPKTKFVGMMQYDGDLKLPARFLVPPPAISGVSGELLAKEGVTTFACSETQKFGHVTFFWNGNRSGYFKEELETYVEIPSDTVPFNEAPEMKAREITEAGKEALLSGKYDMVRVNYANPDMVGHTGDLEAAMSACALVDGCVKELLDTCDKMGGRWLLTADHGNADDMVQRQKKSNEPMMGEDGQPLPLTSHTLAPVPVAIGGSGLPEEVVFRDDLPNAGLANITGTYLNLLGFTTPSHMEPSLI